MWKCQQCGEEIEDTFDACWNWSVGRVSANPAATELESLERGIYALTPDS